MWPRVCVAVAIMSDVPLGPEISVEGRGLWLVDVKEREGEDDALVAAVENVAEKSDAPYL